eukprot:m.239535 g.239535  ORF g.239535 m.239535 type:complete len:319 (+) comp18978_c4_seq4:239-1195(+)
MRRSGLLLPLLFVAVCAAPSDSPTFDPGAQFRKGRFTGPNFRPLVSSSAAHGATYPNSFWSGYQMWNFERGYFGCFMPKVGCTIWLSYMRAMQLPTDFLNSHFDGDKKYFPASHKEFGVFMRPFRQQGETDAELAERARVFRNASLFKWVVVRHPWQRLVSAYRSKYEGECNFSRECLKKRFEVNVSPGTHPLSFHDFVRALTRTPPPRLEPHFRPAVFLCDLDRVQYDYVAELGNPEDTDYVSRRMGFPVTLREYVGDHKTRYSDKVYYGGRTHHVHNCTTQTVDMAAALYGVDAALLGYTFDDAYESCLKHGHTSS